MTGAGDGDCGRVLVVGGACGWVEVGPALGCLGLGSAVPVPHVPGHPTSTCNEGVKHQYLILS